jgi:hypothetical protein
LNVASAAKARHSSTRAGRELGIFPDKATRDYWLARFKADPAHAYYDLLAAAGVAL